MKRTLLQILQLLVVSILLCQCKPAQHNAIYRQIAGETMGTTYECTFETNPAHADVQPAIDSLLELVNAVASTYIPSSSVSQFNRSEGSYCIEISDPKTSHLIHLIRTSKEMHKTTKGYFNPAVMPLVNYWGFGYKNKVARTDISSSIIDSLVSLTNFADISGSSDDDQYCLTKKNKSAELDFSAIAKGYAVDLIATYFGNQGSTNYYVNIGGEVFAKGANASGHTWTLGINYPDTAAGLRDIFAKIELDGLAMASSGNYRNYYVSGKRLYAHTINPASGMANPSDLLSTTIVAGDCSRADAYATACMSMGYDKARRLIESQSDLEGFFIFQDSIDAKMSFYGTSEIMNKIKLK